MGQSGELPAFGHLMKFPGEYWYLGARATPVLTNDST